MLQKNLQVWLKEYMNIVRTHEWYDEMRNAATTCCSTKEYNSNINCSCVALIMVSRHVMPVLVGARIKCTTWCDLQLSGIAGVNVASASSVSA
jgi:hypothetical protein